MTEITISSPAGFITIISAFTVEPAAFGALDKLSAVPDVGAKLKP